MTIQDLQNQITEAETKITSLREEAHAIETAEERALWEGRLADAEKRLKPAQKEFDKAKAEYERMKETWEAAKDAYNDARQKLSMVEFDARQAREFLERL